MHVLAGNLAIIQQTLYVCSLCVVVPDRQSEREGKIADGGSLLAAYCVQFVNRLTK